MKAIRILLACIRKADYMYNLINQGDKIVLGLSGGKDSVALLYCLNLYKKFSNKSFDLQPVLLNLGFDNFDPTPMIDYCNSLGYKLIVEDSTIVYKILKIQQEKQHLKHLPCSICSRMKKAAINKVANELGYNKVAFAHHANDLIETYYMNMLVGGKVASFSAKMYLENAKITFIRPLINAFEDDISRLIKEENLPVIGKVCPADKETNREDIKVMLNSLFKKYPHSRENSLLMMTNNEQEDLLFNHLNYPLNDNGDYIKPVVGSYDKFLELDIRLKVFVQEYGFDYDLEANPAHEKDYFAFVAFTKDNIPFGTIGYKIIDEKVIKVERLAILKEYRKKGYGRQIFGFLHDYIMKKYYPKYILIHAVTTYRKMYESFGFKAIDHEFYEGTLKTIKMVFEPKEKIKPKPKNKEKPE